MIFLSAALHCEAKPIINQFKLKKDLNLNKFQIFKNDNIILIITKTGIVNSAVAVSYLLSNHKVSKSDIFLNIGICGTYNQNLNIGSAFLCNKIIEHDTNKCFYPDVLFKHHFYERSIETFSSTVNNLEFDFKADLIDMEASGIYQAASLFFQPHQIFFIKIVSDYLYNSQEIKSEYISNLINDNLENIFNWCFDIDKSLKNDSEIFTKEEYNLIKNAVEKLNLSFSMKVQLEQMLLYYKLKNEKISILLKEYLKDTIDCKSKTEGKKYLNEIKQRIIQ